MATSTGAPGSDTVLPSSRRPVPGSEQYRAETERRQASSAAESANAAAERKKNRSVADIEAEINAKTDELATHIDELVGRLSPKQLARRGAGNARRLVVDADGGVRAEVVGAIVGTLVGTAFVIWWARRGR